MINIKFIYLEFIFSFKSLRSVFIPIFNRINEVFVVNFFWEHFVFLIAI